MTTPVIPNSVIKMVSTFEGCSSLVNVSNMPNSVTRMGRAFSGCTSLVTAPEIPNSVTSMAHAFYGCINLTGTIIINNRNVDMGGSNTNHAVASTQKPITVEVPIDSATYTDVNSHKPANVTVTTFTPE